MLTKDDLQKFGSVVDEKILKLRNEVINDYLKPMKKQIVKTGKEEHTTTGYLDRRDHWIMKRVDLLEDKIGIVHPPQIF